MNRHVAFALKLLMSLSLLAWIGHSVNFERLAKAASGISLHLLIYSALLLMAQLLVNAWRWHRVVHLMGGQLPASKALRWVLVGQFLNQLLPTSIGGDGYRIWALNRLGTAPGMAFASVAIERGTGLVLMGLMISVSVPSLPLGFPATQAWLLVAAGPCLLLGLLVLGSLQRASFRWPQHRAMSLVQALSLQLSALFRSPRATFEVALLGVLGTLLGLTSAWMIGLGLGISAGLLTYVALVGGALLLAVLPISLGGWGVREVGIVGLFAGIGVGMESALALSIVWGLLPLLISLPFGLLWLMSEKSAFATPTTFR